MSFPGVKKKIQKNGNNCHFPTVLSTSEDSNGSPEPEMTNTRSLIPNYAKSFILSVICYLSGTLIVSKAAATQRMNISASPVDNTPQIM